MTPMEQSNCQTDNGNVLDELLKASRILADDTYQGGCNLNCVKACS